MRCGAVLSLVFLAACPSGVRANDSTAFQGTGGLELTKTDDIRMESEDLRIGLDEISVSYVFRNTASHPIETVVAFPMPDLDLAPGLTASNWQFPVADRNFLGFRVWVDGRPVEPALDLRAVYQGRDVTGELAASGGFSLVPWMPGAYDEQAKRLDPAALKRLRDRGLVRSGDDENNPQWTLQPRFHWTQTFAAGQETRVRHVYKPLVGYALVENVTRDIDGRKAYGRPVGPRKPEPGDRYCIDDGTRRAFTVAQAKVKAGTASYDVAEIEYILTTARNWSGPIGRFHLTIDKGAPENLLSLCWDGLKKTGPTTFEATVTDFVPKRDLALLILQKHTPVNR